MQAADVGRVGQLEECFDRDLIILAGVVEDWGPLAPQDAWCCPAQVAAAPLLAMDGQGAVEAA